MESKEEKFERLKAELASRIEVVQGPDFGSLSANDIVGKLTIDKKGDFKSRLPGSAATDSYFMENIKHNKKAIVDFCIEHPEMSYNILYWPLVFELVKKKDFAGYTKEQIVKIPKVVREVIIHPEDIYKLKVKHKIDETFFYYLPNTNYWEALEWIAKYAPDKLKYVITKKSEFNPFGRKNVVAHYKAVEDKDTIPEAIRDYLDGSDKLHDIQSESGKLAAELKREKELEKMLTWYDKNGEIIKLFDLSDGMKISSLDDYCLIASYFVQSDLSVSEFCRKYQIENVKGFKLMCEKLSLVDENFAAFYQDNLEKKSTAYVAIIKHQIEDVAYGRLSIEDLLTTQSQMKSFGTVMEIGLSTVREDRLCRFVETVIDYYYDRMNSYEPNSTELNDICNRLSEAEVKFLMSSRVIAKRKMGDNVNLGVEFAKPFARISKNLSPYAQSKVYNGKKGLHKRLDSYSDDYNPEEYLSGETQFMLPNGQFIQPTQEMLDMAEAYASKHKLFKSAGTMSRVIKAVAEGKIQNQAETEDYKKMLQEMAIKKMKECKTIEEYFAKYRSL